MPHTKLCVSEGHLAARQGCHGLPSGREAGQRQVPAWWSLFSGTGHVSGLEGRQCPSCARTVDSLGIFVTL